MSTIGTFQSISDGYFQAGKQAFHYASKRFLLFKIIFYPIALIIYLFMAAGGIFFRFFIVLDWISSFVDGLRKSVLQVLRNLQDNIPNSFFAFLINPFLIVLLAPVFFICVILPKFSSPVSGLLGDSMEQFSEGAFREMNKISWGSAHNLFRYVANAPLLLKPFVSIIAIFLSCILIIAGAAFFVLIILDVISGVIEKMRKWLVSLTHSVAENTGKHFFGFFTAPVLMLILIPVLVCLLIVPKFSSGLDLS